MTFTDEELDGLTADLRHGTLDIETGEKLDAGSWASVAVEEIETTIRAITYLRNELYAREYSLEISEEQLGRARAQLSKRDPIGAAIMQERAAKVCETIEETLRQGYAATSANAVGEAYSAICAIPLPTPAETLAYALQLPEIKAMVEAARPYTATVNDADFGRQMREYEALVAALAALEPKP